MSRYVSVNHDGDAITRYHGYVLANEGSENRWPGEWWQPVYPPWGRDSVTENMLVEWLKEQYPNQSWAIQEVVWVAEPVRFRESNGSTSYVTWGMR